MSHDPRYVDDGLAELVDRLELELAYEAYPVRYVLGMDPAALDDVVVAELRAGRLFLLPDVPLTIGVLP